MAQNLNNTDVTPQPIMEDLWAAWRTQALIAGVELDVFTHIAAGKRTAKEIARAAKASENGVTRLLDALVGMGYLTRKGDKYGLSPVADMFLDKNKESYVGDMAFSQKLTWQIWGNLTDSVRSGRSVNTVDQDTAGREFFPKLVAAIFPMSFQAARVTAAQLPGKDKKSIKHILDVAAGSGAWSIAFAQALPDARVTVIDYPEVTPITRQFTERLGVADRYDYVEGNLREIDFGRNKYDLIILGHIIHSEGEKWGKKLIKKCYRALGENGLLLIGEMVPNDTRTGPAQPLLFGLNMLLHTERGDVFTMREYREWLKDAGFKKVSTIDAPAPSPLILARK